ncbi:homoserine/homoserine lactone efflux protein [Thaumasiovibrio subtropicus]|uniref:homoserine/homoserine lactone efflux protein n=1 Tax=Thaumasiovibrio subtropicus TaxID=1891207 RepID=UPI000B351267|nr:homoserine/homoserine lactone efflux protein [Thaumasiovibrio subtropicus]
MVISVWLAFVAACVVFSFSPGAGMVATVSNTLNGGIRIAFKNIIGLQLALCVHLLVVSLGLGALLASSAVAFTILKYCGAAYLIYLGVMKFRSKASLTADENTQLTAQSTAKIIRQGFLINMMNPKSIIFLAAFLPQFISPEAPMAPQYLILGLTVLVVDTVVMVTYASLARSVQRFFRSSAAALWQNRVFGSMFIAMGGMLAAAER